MYAGLDFGTSNCSIGVWKNNTPTLTPLEANRTRLPSALYTYRQNISIDQIDELDLRKRVGIAKRKQISEFKKAQDEKREFKIFSNVELESIERGIMLREIAKRAKSKYERQSIDYALYADRETFFGEDAIRRHIQEPEKGYFIKSPKPFLGAKIESRHIKLFSEVITRMLAFLKFKAEKYSGKEIESVILGRPVNFHGTRGEDGNLQATSILQDAALVAGFKNIEFLLEPIAAALDFERGISKNLVALILDTGGGTTDCSMVKIGPSYMQLSDRKDSILGSKGDRIGGIDIDLKLSLRKIMPYFGKDSLLSSGLPIPSTIFWNAISVHDVDARSKFLSSSTQHEILSYLDKTVEKDKLKRLQTLHKDRLQIRLNRSTELAKIHLSDRDWINLPLRYIEPDLVIPISRQDLKECIEKELDTFLSLMREVERQANVVPDIIYVTGGTAKSPIIEEWIRSHYRNIKIVIGDLYGSVASGLTTWAHRVYQ